MKKTKKTQTPTFTPAPVGKDPLERRKKAEQSGCNDHTEELGPITALLLENYDTFSLLDFISLSESLDVPFTERERFFNSFVEQALKEQSIKEIPTCYKGKLFKIL